MKGSIVAAITLPFLIATGAAANSSVPEQVGLRLQSDEITTTFRGYLTQYEGGCSVSDWSGPAASDKIRFFSRSTPPAENLRVQLQSLTTGESLEKAYEKEGKGSSDFSLQKLGEGDGNHEIEYQIFDQQTDQLVEKGTFVYTVITSQITRYRQALSNSDHLCGSPSHHSLQHCDSILWPHSLYGHGSSRCNGFVRHYPHRYHPSFRRRFGKRLKHKHFHHDHQKQKFHPKQDLKEHKSIHPKQDLKGHKSIHPKQDLKGHKSIHPKQDLKEHKSIHPKQDLKGHKSIHPKQDLKEHKSIHLKPVQAKQVQKRHQAPLQPRHTIEEPPAQKKMRSKPQMPRRTEGGSAAPQHVKTPRNVKTPRKVTRPREKAPSQSLNEREPQTTRVPVRRRQSVITPRRRTETPQRSARQASRRRQRRRLRPQQRRTLTPSTTRTVPNRRIQRRVVNRSFRSPRRRAPIRRAPIKRRRAR